MSEIVAVTSLSPDGYNAYGKRMVSTFKEFWPESVKLVVTLDSDVPDKIQANNIEYKILDNIDLLAFKDRHSNNPMAHGLGPHAIGTKANFTFDAVRFSHKVFALTDQARKMSSGILLWLDGDTRTHSLVTTQLINSWLPMGKFAGFLDRPKLYTETGFHIFRMDHLFGKTFFDIWELYYKSDKVFDLPAWTDCHTYDAARLKFDKLAWVSLSPDFTHPHPFINGILGDVMDHMKGPRKINGSSKRKDLVTARNGYWNNVT